MAEQPTDVDLEKRVRELEISELEYEKAAQQLREREELYRSFVQNFNGIAFRGRMDFTPVFFQGAVQEITGYTAREFLDGNPRWDQIIHPKDLRSFFTEDEKRLHVTPRYAYEREYRIVRKDGAERWVHEVIQNICDDSGRPAYLQGTIYDITERKKADEALKNSEKKYRQLFEKSTDAIFMVDKSTGRYLDANAAAEKLTGYPVSALKKLTTQIVTPKSAKRRLEMIESSKGCTHFRGVVYIRPDGSERIATLSIVPIDDKTVYGIARDTTERTRAKAALRESEQKYKSLANNLNVGIYRNSVGSKGRFIEANPAIVKMFGFDSREEFLKVSVSDLYENPDDRNAYNAKLLRETEVRNEELQLRRKDGTTFIGSISAVVVRDEKDNVRYYDGIVEDITERKLAEEALRESEEKYRHLFETAMVGIYRTRIEDGKFLAVNQVLAEMMGYPTIDALMAEYLTSEHYADPKRREMLLSQLASKGSVDGFEIEMKRADGSPIQIAISATVYSDHGYLEGFIIDITDRVQTETALRESEERYRGIVEDNTEFIVRWKPDGTRTFANRAYCKYLEKSAGDVIGTNVFDDVIEQDREQLRQTVSSLSPDNPVAYTHERKSYGENKIVWQAWVERGIFDKQGRLFEIQSVGRDITDLKKAEAEKAEAEEKLRQAEKMEAIGTLAGGIAHDFNNILSAILGYSELALADLPPEASIRNKLEAIHSSGERARDLVAQILAFSRKDEQVRSPVELHLILEDALKLLRPAIPTTIEIQVQVTSKCRILGDPSRVHQIIMNLCTNAYQSMLESGGTLNITLSHEELEGKAAALSHIHAGSYGKLVISDTGAGIRPENLERIFDPYFTTKDKGKGTGLGLAVVHGICKSHGGSILVESQIGKGTQFQVYLPLIPDRDDTRKQADLQLPGGNERILLVDDEQDIREIEKEMLEIQGYRVTGKDNAQEALKLFAEQPERFDLVITDMTMPNMTGDRLAAELRKIRSDMPIILSTGYSELMSKEKAKSLGIKGFLMKPFTMRDLSNTIREVLDDKEDTDMG